MDCRIQVLEEGSVRLVRVAGDVRDVHVPDLLAACSQITGGVNVDLSHVLTVDVVAVEALRRLRDSGADLVAVPTYIQLKLESG